MNQPKSRLWKTPFSLLPHNTAAGGVCYTINTRYEFAAISDYTHAKHAKTCIMAVYEN